MNQKLPVTFAFKTQIERDEIERRSKLIDTHPNEVNELAAYEKDLRLRYIKTSREDFFAYLTTLQDAVPGKDGSHELTDNTTLVPLWKPKKSEPFHQVISNLCGVANTWQRCYLERPNGELVPTPRPDFAFDRNDCNMFVSYRSLLYAPCVRLELRFYDSNSVNGDGRVHPFHKVTVDFHWANDSHHPGKRGVYDYAYSKDTNKDGHKAMTFRSGFATVSGLTVAVQRFTDRTTKGGKQLLEMIDQMIEPTRDHLVTLHCIQEVPRPKPMPQGDNDANEITRPTGSHLVAPHCIQKVPRPEPMPHGSNDANEITRPTESHLVAPHCIQKVPRPKPMPQVDNCASEIIWPAKPDLLAVQAYLPGGDGFLPSSLFSLEYPFFRNNQGTMHILEGAMPKRKQLINNRSPHPMVPMLCEDTFSSIEEWATQWTHFCTVANEEEKRRLELWTTVPHLSMIITVGTFSVVVVHFNDFPKLSASNQELKFRLPDDSYVEMSYRASQSGELVRLRGFHATGQIGGLPSASAYFVGTNKCANEIADSVTLDEFCKAKDSEHKPAFEILMNFTLKRSELAYRSQIYTCQRSLLKENQRWHANLLNQRHTLVPKIDIATYHTSSIDAGRALNKEMKMIDAAFDRLLKYKDWNAEQKEALHFVRNSQGGMVLIMGSAGTGKTLIQEALTKFFYEIGLHVLCLAPANSNVDDFTNRMAAVLPEVGLKRLHPAKYEYGMDSMRSPEEALEKDNQESVEFDILVDHMNRKINLKAEARQHGFRAAVMETAIQGTKNGSLKIHHWNRHRHKHLKDGVDAWAELQEMIQRIDNEAFDWDSEDNRRKLRHCYTHCYHHLIALTKVISATTGDACADPLRKNFAFGLYGQEVKGVVVIVDEAAKDLEINIFNAVFERTWNCKVSGLICLGDEEQLKPTNTCAFDPVQFAEFRRRGDISLPKRLVAEGFQSVVHLKEQNRMHPDIAEFVNKWFYKGSLCNAPATQQTLGQQYPGLAETLRRILMDLHCIPETGDASEMMLRVRYLELHAERRLNQQTKSAVVLEIAELFMESIWPKLHELFGDKMAANVFVIAAYRETVYWWRTLIQNAMRKADNPRDVTHYPTVITVDSSQGREALMTFLDLAVQKVDSKADIGFVKAASRVNVALTRGKGVVWTAGGGCEGRSQKNIPAIAAFRNHCVEKGLCSVVHAPEIPDSKIPPQLLGLGFPGFSPSMVAMAKDDQADADDSGDCDGWGLEYTSERAVVE
ncbi:hypothetical protein KC343_g4392 [Hortaea werneckii]|nr:hypothetical protein KC352_g8857 [Hortaea werneckii]KAI7568098.1 hypothetical protein KC317_g4496 [Hortaea werneckii]KAI7620434.1 hypothetical protein KC346_g4109 [Hortaea werneckii]KAI7630817.1 hypothetical protein KC343_g4392 [Hortaea werneckii]KAI7679414.1 hypothetical protein KC319_g2783 [Hortaea werneckii]